jgi:uncharacterized protein (TIGR02246 family)
MVLTEVKGAATTRNASMETKIRTMAANYAAAWSSQNAASVASYFATDGSLQINANAPAVGRAAITASAQSFMTAFPDMVVAMDSLTVDGSSAVFHWTLTGTNSGPGGTGKAVRFSGYEEWTIDANGFIQRSLGHYDEADYQRQLKEGVSGA